MLATLALVMVVVFAGWPWIKPPVKAWLAKHGVMFAWNVDTVMFPDANAQPTRAIHQRLFGVEVHGWFVGTFKTNLLTRQVVEPAPAPKIIVPS